MLRNSWKLGLMPNVAISARRGSPKAMTGVVPGIAAFAGKGRRTIRTKYSGMFSAIPTNWGSDDDPQIAATTVSE